jgi:hypothetical protein
MDSFRNEEAQRLILKEEIVRDFSILRTQDVGSIVGQAGEAEEKEEI